MDRDRSEHEYRPIYLAFALEIDSQCDLACTISGIFCRLRSTEDAELNFQREPLARFRALVLLIIPATLICAPFGGYWLSGHALAPVREIIASVRSINELSLSLRLRVPLQATRFNCCPDWYRLPFCLILMYLSTCLRL